MSQPPLPCVMKWIHDHGRPVPIDEPSPELLARALADDQFDLAAARDFLRGFIIYGQFMEELTNVIVARTLLEHPRRGGARVATDFLGLDHSRTGMRGERSVAPILWETMTFFEGGGGENEDRYETLPHARHGHRAAVERLRSRGYKLVKDEVWPLGQGEDDP